MMFLPLLGFYFVTSTHCLPQSGCFVSPLRRKAVLCFQYHTSATQRCRCHLKKQQKKPMAQATGGGAMLKEKHGGPWLFEKNSFRNVLRAFSWQKNTSNRLWFMIIGSILACGIFRGCLDHGFVILGFLKNLHDWEGLAYWNVCLIAFECGIPNSNIIRIYTQPHLVKETWWLFTTVVVLEERKAGKISRPYFLWRGPAVGKWAGNRFP